MLCAALEMPCAAPEMMKVPGVPQKVYCLLKVNLSLIKKNDKSVTFGNSLPIPIHLTQCSDVCA